MMATAMVEKIDGELMVKVPRELHVLEGDTVAINHHESEPASKKTRRYTLEQLIAEHEQIADQLEEDRAWLDAPRVGRELI